MGSHSDISASGTSSPLMGHTSLSSGRDSRGMRDPRDSTTEHMTIVRTEDSEGQTKYIMVPRNAASSGGGAPKPRILSGTGSSASTERSLSPSFPQFTSLSSPYSTNLRHSLYAEETIGPDVIPRHS